MVAVTSTPRPKRGLCTNQDHIHMICHIILERAPRITSSATATKWEGAAKEGEVAACLDDDVGALKDAPELAPDLQVLLKGRQHQQLLRLNRRQLAPPRQERRALLRIHLLRALLPPPRRPPRNAQPATQRPWIQFCFIFF